MLASFVAFLKDGEERKVIDVGLLILMIILGVASFLLGWVFCAIFSYCKADDVVHPCETLKDITRRNS